MSIDLKRAIVFPFVDPKWPQKLLIGGIFYLIVNFIQTLNWLINSFIKSSSYGYEQSLPAIIISMVFGLLMFIISTIATAFPIGYALQSAHNEIKNETPLLPDWDSNFFKYFKYGIFYYFINLIYAFIAMVIVAIPFTIGFSVFNLYQDMPAISFSGLMFAIFFIIPVVLFYLIISPFVTISYANNFNFQDAFRIDKILNNILKAIPEYLTGIGMAILIPIAFGILSVILVCTCLGILLVPFLTLPALLITLNVFSQAYKQSQPSV